MPEQTTVCIYLLMPTEESPDRLSLRILKDVTTFDTSKCARPSLLRHFACHGAYSHPSSCKSRGEIEELV